MRDSVLDVAGSCTRPSIQVMTVPKRAGGMVLLAIPAGSSGRGRAAALQARDHVLNGGCSTCLDDRPREPDDAENRGRHKQCFPHCLWQPDVAKGRRQKRDDKRDENPQGSELCPTLFQRLQVLVKAKANLVFCDNDISLRHVQVDVVHSRLHAAKALDDSGDAVLGRSRLTHSCPPSVAAPARPTRAGT